MAYKHNNTIADREPTSGTVDKTSVPRLAHTDVKEEGKKAAAQGAGTGNKAKSKTIGHLQAHQNILGLGKSTNYLDWVKQQLHDIAAGIGIVHKQSTSDLTHAEPIPEPHFLPHIADKIFNIPLMITSSKLDVITSILGPRIGLLESQKELLESQKELLMQGPGTLVRQSNQTAIIPIHGTLVYHGFGSVDALSGMTSYKDIKSIFDEANRDSKIKSIVFDIDSNGGESAGVFDLVDHIVETKQKPLIAVVNENAYSAAYAIASAADKIYIPRTGGVGSIGVRALHIDKSKQNESQGLKYTPIFAGARKNDFSPNEPLSDEAFKVIKTQVDDVYDLFVKTVAENRKMSQKAVRDTEAGVFQGQKAIDAGLADEIKSFSQVMELQRNGKTKGGKRKMGVDIDTNVEPQTVDLEELKKEAVRVERDRVADIRNACKTVRKLGLTEEFENQLIESGVDIQEANTKIIDFLACKSEKTNINPNLSSIPNSIRTSLIENAKLRAASQRGVMV